MKKTEDKESRATVDENKVKEKVKAAVTKCWKGFWLSLLKATGEISNEAHIFNCQGFSEAKITIFLRDLDPAFCRPFCYGGLRNPRNYVLQQ